MNPGPTGRTRGRVVSVSRKMSAVVAVVAGCLLTACTLVGQLLEGDDDESSSSDTHVADARQLERALRLYRNCHESLAGTIGDSYARYVAIAGEDDEPQRSRRLFVYGVTQGAFRVCDGAQAELREPGLRILELDEVLSTFLLESENYADASLGLAELLRESKPDGAAVATLHVELLQAYRQWSAQADRLDASIEAAQRDNDEAYLEQLREEGSGLEFRARKLMVLARATTRCLTSLQEQDCSDSFDELSTAVDDFHAYRSQHADEASRVFWLRTFVTDLDDLRRAARELATSSKERRKTVDSSEMRRLYRVLARDAATLDFAFPNQQASR